MQPGPAAVLPPQAVGFAYASARMLRIDADTSSAETSSAEMRGRSARERFDPPVLRLQWTTLVARPRAEFLAEELAAHAAGAGWDGAIVARVLRHGGVHLAGRPHGGDDLPAQIAAGTPVDLHAFAWEPEPIELAPERLLAERGDWIAVDNPAHIAVQATRASRIAGLEQALQAARGEPGLVAVHRLDRETSGVVVFARDARAAARLGAVFRDRRARKRYVALVSPPPAQESFEITGYLARTLHPTRYRYTLRSSPAPGHRASHTRLRMLARDGELALLEAEPVTGRTHQIRVHLEAAGSPIVGDTRYGGRAAARVQLHAAELAFVDRGEAVELRAPAPDDVEPAFAALLERASA
jgi:23S rRNA pseudouridine1911/1915/1917 synthase